MSNESENLPRILPLRGAIQHYDWGGVRFIPGLLGLKNPDDEPFAELWMGAHPKSPSYARVDGVEIALDELIDSGPEEILGPEVAARFAGHLPFLFKILDVQKMLSIQVHPSRAQAEAGFARETAAGISLTAPERNYRDRNHKPEIHVALSEFWMLHGFRPLEEIRDTFAAIEELQPLLTHVPALMPQRRRTDQEQRTAMHDVYQHIMKMPQSTADAILAPLAARLQDEYANSRLKKDAHAYWFVRALRDFPPAGGHFDRCLFSIFLMNLICLNPGEGTFQPPGTPHAYLEGINVELMANSDNVLRAGLTHKHVDIPELVRILDFRCMRPHIIAGCAVSENEIVFAAAVQDFRLSQVRVSRSCPFRVPVAAAPDIYIVLEGEIAVELDGESKKMRKGSIFLIKAGRAYRLLAPITATLYRATVPAPAEAAPTRRC